MIESQNKDLTKVFGEWIAQPHRQLSKHSFLKHYQQRTKHKRKSNRISGLAFHYFHLYQLLHIYQALETKLNTMLHQHQILKDCFDQELQKRSSQILDDIRFIENNFKLPEQAHQLRQQQPSVTQYVNRIMAIDSPITLLAHHMTRLLAEQNGGQRQSKQVMSIFQQHGLSPNNGQGVRFYHFQQSNPKELYRRLDELTITEAEKQQFGKQAAEAFHYHQHIYNDCEMLVRNHSHYLQIGSEQRPKQQQTHYSDYCRRGLVFFGLATAYTAAALGAFYKVLEEEDPAQLPELN